MSGKTKGQEYKIDGNSEIAGNKPFELNRTTVSNSFRMSNTSHIPLNVIEGYDAQGRIVYRGAKENPFIPKPDQNCYQTSNNEPVVSADVYFAHRYASPQGQQGRQYQQGQQPQTPGFEEYTGIPHWDPNQSQQSSIADYNRKRQSEIINSTADEAAYENGWSSDCAPWN